MHPSGPHPPIWFLVFPLVLCCRSFRLKHFFLILSPSILIMWPVHPTLLILMSSTMFGPLYKLYSSLFPQDYAVCKIFRALRVWDTTKNLGLSFLFWIKRIAVSSRRPLVRLSFFLRFNWTDIHVRRIKYALHSSSKKWGKKFLGG